MSLEHFCEAESIEDGTVALALVTNMLDWHLQPTLDPSLAVSCVIHLPNGQFCATGVKGLFIGAKH